MKTLVIDDSRAVRAILRKYLQAMGHTVLEAGDGAAALDLLRQNPDAALALVDWNMPVMDGLALVKAVRAEPAIAGVRLIMVTTETEMEHVAKALEAGADEYIMKPFTQEMIAEKLSLAGLSAGQTAESAPC